MQRRYADAEPLATALVKRLDKRMPADAPILKRAQDTLVHVNDMRGQSEQARSLRQQFESDRITKRLNLEQSKPPGS